MSENEGIMPTKGNASGSAWDRERQIQSARPPKLLPEEHKDPSSGAGSNNDVAEIAKNSKLNAEAQEFVPQWSQASAAEGMHTFPNLAYQRGVVGVERGPIGDLAPTRCYIGPVPYRYQVVNPSKNLPMPLPIQQYPISYIPPQNPVPLSFPLNPRQLGNGYPSKFQGSTTDDISYLAEVIDVLSLNPGRYDDFITPIEDIVESLQNDSRALAQVIDLIMQQCIVEPNFRYTGARICSVLNLKFGNCFIGALLTRCHERFSRLDAVMTTDRPSGIGFAMFLAELFHQIKLGNEHVSQLADGVMEVLHKFLLFPFYDVVRCVVQIIKLCGVDLEKTQKPVQPIFSLLEELAQSDRADENCRRIIAGLMHLRRTEWADLMSDSNVPSPAPVPTTSDEPVFYSPDGQVMSEEERSFLCDQMPDAEDRDDYVLENEAMDNETFEAFQEFVKFSQNNYKNHNKGVTWECIVGSPGFAYYVPPSWLCLFTPTVMENQTTENGAYHTTPNRSDCSKNMFSRRRTFDRSVIHPYKSTIELNSTALAPDGTLPLYTPPKPSQHVKNPFEQAWLLKERLSQPICSPSLFQKAISPINKSSTFSWSIDDISHFRPAPIDENPSQEFASWFSPDTETQAQAAIDRFFSSQGTLDSPITSRNTSLKANVACQTNLTFPPILPEAIEAELEALSQRLKNHHDESMNTLNSSTCSARRKILPVEVYPASDDESELSLIDQDESMRFAATPVKFLPCSSPECSPIPKEATRSPNFQQDMSICMTEESLCKAQSPSR